jgi:hypothetical protein
LQARGDGDSGVSASMGKRAAPHEVDDEYSASYPMEKRQMLTKLGQGLVSTA